MSRTLAIALLVLALAAPSPARAEEGKKADPRTRASKSWPDIGRVVQSAVDYAWKQFVVPPIRKHTLDWLKTWEGRELDGKHLVLLEVKDVYAQLPGSPSLETLDQGRVALHLPGEGTWAVEVDLKVKVDYGFLFWRWKDEVDLTLRLNDLRSTVVLDISGMKPGGAGLAIDEFVTPTYSIDVKSDHRFVKRHRKRILKTLDKLAAQYIAESQRALTQAKAERLAAAKATPALAPRAAPAPAHVASSRSAPSNSR